MNTQPPTHTRSSVNGLGRRRSERDMGTRPENKSLGKSNSSSRIPNIGNSAGHVSPSRDRLVYVSTSLIGLQVDVQVKSGAVYSGIFHATNPDKDIGVVLKMARMIKGGLKSSTEPVNKAPIKTLVIPSKELVQVIAKDVSLTRDGFAADIQSEKQAELMIDSNISQSRSGEMERELGRWVPDDDDLPRPELENVFDGGWNRGWDQFEANEALFGVKSTFDEELYTTKLDRGPQMREREREAHRIAREIEGEDTRDLHLAEERGIQLSGKLDVDEETKYSAVSRGKIVDDDGYEENEDTLLDSCNDETFGDSSTPDIKSENDWTNTKIVDAARAPSSSYTMDQAQSSQSSDVEGISRSDSHDHTRHLSSESPIQGSSTPASDSRKPENQLGVTNESSEKKSAAEGTHLKSDDSSSSLTAKKDGADKEASFKGNSSASYRTSSKFSEKSEQVDSPSSGKPPHGREFANSHGRPGSSASSRSDYVVAPPPSGPGLSPSSSVGSLSSEKSSLNPYAKEFKLNPNAKSFVPLQSPMRPPSPIADGSYYFQANAPPSVPQIPNMHVGITPSFGQQPVVYNAQGAQLQAPQAYFHPNGPPQYTQQMFVHQPRPVMYMPGYHQPETQYRGRDY